MRIEFPEVRAGSEPDRLSLRVPEELYWFEGHFPNDPILPAVVQVHWAMHFAQQLGIDTKQFRGLPRLKFMQIVRPNDELLLELDRRPNRLDFRYLRDGLVCSRGSIAFESN